MVVDSQRRRALQKKLGTPESVGLPRADWEVWAALRVAATTLRWRARELHGLASPDRVAPIVAALHARADGLDERAARLRRAVGPTAP